MGQLAYKANAAATMQRLRSLYDRVALDQIFAVFELPSVALAEFRREHPEPFCSYPDPRTRIRFWDEFLREKAPLEDDSMPSAYLSEFDQGLYGGLVGGEVRFMAHSENGWISSMVPPLLRNWSGLGSLSLAETSPWWQLYLDQLSHFTAGAMGRFGISHFILIDSLNFAFELVGATHTYLSLSEHSEAVRKAIEFAFHLNLKVQAAFFERVPLFEGGTFSNMVQWIPGRIISESVDPFHMTSVACFEEWGREAVQRMFDRFDGGVLHLHGNGRHLLEAVSSLRGLKAVHMGDDRGFIPASEILPDLRARAGTLPLVVNLEYPAFVHKLTSHELAGGILYRVQNTPGPSDANRWMKSVRDYRV